MKLKLGARIVPVSWVQPNTWNPNEMSPEFYAKLKANLKEQLKKTGKVPPIIVRPNRERECYEIVDGEHRWKAMQELKQTKISIYSIEADDKLARILTTNLNYLRGKPNRERYVQGIVEMIELGTTVEDITALLPEDAESINTILEEARISLKAYENILSESEEEGVDSDAHSKDAKDAESESWVDLKFQVSVGQLRIIEKELDRIGSKLKGKNARARALEYAMVLSSQCPIPEDLVSGK